MTRWISQASVPSITAATRQRTAYLTPLRQDIVSAIHTYLAANPDGEDVTRFVLSSLGRSSLETLRGHRSLGRVKQDVGLLVAQTLVDLYGVRRVETLRREDGRSVTSRRNNQEGLDWVNSFAPHRVLPMPPIVERIVLDTGVIRKVIHGDADAIDLNALARVKGQHPVSIADGAYAEIAAALLRNSVRIEEWSARIGLFDSILDPDFPVFPGGRELTSFCCGRPQPGMDLEEVKAFYRAAWVYLRSANSSEDLTRNEVYISPSGRNWSLGLTRQHVDGILSEIGQRWANFIANIAIHIRTLRGQGHVITEDELHRVTSSSLMVGMGCSDARKLDLVVRVLSRRAIEAANGATPYRAGGTPNDPLDLDLLFAIPIPAWICTSDSTLYNLVQQTTSADRNSVFMPDGLIERLSRGTATTEP